MKINPTALRKNLYQLLDQVLESGEPIIIERNGRELVISEKKRKGIYQIMDEKLTHQALEPKQKSTLEADQKALEGLDEKWEEKWMKKWDEWLNEK